MQRSQIRPTILAALQAAPALAGIPVVIDNNAPGEPDTAQENALKSTGSVIAIWQILRTKPLSHAAGAEITASAEVAIHLRVNPERNDAQSTPIDPDVIIDAIIEILLGLKNQASPLVISPGEELTRFIPEDSGCVTHASYFNARTWVRV
jgi:hypothetical protein